MPGAALGGGNDVEGENAERVARLLREGGRKGGERREGGR